MRKHILYKTGDSDCPDVILDGNGEVTLGLCRICGKGEADLAEDCVAGMSKARVEELRRMANNSFGDFDLSSELIECLDEIERLQKDSAENARIAKLVNDRLNEGVRDPFITPAEKEHLSYLWRLINK